MKRTWLVAGIPAATLVGWSYEVLTRRHDAGRAGSLLARAYEAGEGRPSVVLLHGAGDCAASWLLVELRASVSDEEYRWWEANVCRTFASRAGSDLQVVVPVTVTTKQLRTGVVDPQLGDLPLGYWPATRSARSGSSGCAPSPRSRVTASFA